jgi:hypothetical protein
MLELVPLLPPATQKENHFIENIFNSAPARSFYPKCGIFYLQDCVYFYTERFCLSHLSQCIIDLLIKFLVGIIFLDNSITSTYYLITNGLIPPREKPGDLIRSSLKCIYNCST